MVAWGIYGATQVLHISAARRLCLLPILRYRPAIPGHRLEATVPKQPRHEDLLSEFWKRSHRACRRWFEWEPTADFRFAWPGTAA